MGDDSYKKALADVLAELASLSEQRNDIDRRIAKLRQSATSLQSLIEDEEGNTSFDFTAELAEIGLTDACREVLKARGSWMAATAIRDGLASVGYDITGQKNPLSSIHNVLKRLEDADEIEVGKLVDEGGTKVYKWKGASPFKHGNPIDGPDSEMNRLIRESFKQRRERILADAKKVVERLSDDELDATMKAVADAKVERYERPG